MIGPSSTLAEVRAAVLGGSVSSVEVAEHYWERSRRLDVTLNAFTWFNPGLLDEVRAAEAPLLPIAVKDVQAVRGLPNTKASYLLPDEPEAEHAPFIDRVLRAGFALLGRTTSSELAASLATESLRYGVTRNPWNPTITAAGSSGGSAVAVAAGMVPVATGTDGFGSIRLPAVACNLVGLKVTRGLLPQQVGPWDWSSVDGFLTRTVKDAALSIDLVASPDPAAWIVQRGPAGPALSDGWDAAPPRLRIGVMTVAPNGAAVDDANVAATMAVADRLAATGHEVMEVGPELLRVDGFDAYRRVVAPVWSHLLDYDLSRPADPAVVRRLRAAEGVGAIEFVRCVAALRDGARRGVERLLAGPDLLLTPLTGCAFPPHGALAAEAADPDSGQPVSTSMRAFVETVNVLGLPAVGLPTHVDPHGVPFGVQLVGRPHDELVLLQVAGQLERELGWTERRLPEAFR